MNNVKYNTNSTSAVVQKNKVLTNTYILLSTTLLFSGIMSLISYSMGVGFVNPFITLGLYFLTLFMTYKNKNKTSGIFWVFCLTGVLGFTLGPILNYYINALSNGSEIVTLSLLTTGTIFLSLSAYANVTKKSFSFLRGFLFSGILIAFSLGIFGLIASMFGYFFPLLMLMVSGMFAVLMCGLILYQTSEIINGGETNYILATVTLYVSIYNLFTSLLHIFGSFMGDD